MTPGVANKTRRPRRRPDPPPVTVRVEEDLFEEVRVFARAKGLSLREAARRLVKLGLKVEL